MLSAMIKKNERRYRKKLRYLEDKEVWKIKVFCDIERLKRTFIKENSDIIKIDAEINVASDDRVLSLKKEKEHLIKNVLRKEIRKYEESIFMALEKLSTRKRIDMADSKEPTEQEGGIILNAVFLVAINHTLEFTDTVLELKNRYHAVGLDIGSSGPCSPYNFNKL